MAGDRGEAGDAESLRLSALNLALRLFAKPRMRRMGDPAAARRAFAAFTGLLPSPPYLLDLPGIVPGGAGPLPVSRISVGPVDRTRVILYLHGGAFVLGSPETHRGMIGRLSQLAGVPVLAPDYRLAPEHPFPAAVEDAAAAWQHLYDAGYDPEDIVIGGDSAGGGLAFALLARLCAAGTPPAGVFAFSPWVDLTLGSPSLAENRGADPLLPVERVEEVRGYYLNGGDPADPAASPVLAAFPGAPPVLLHHAATEILRDDTLRLAARLRGFGAPVQVACWPTAPHAWHLFDGWLPEARAALRGAAAFVRDRLRPAPPPSAGS